MNASSMGVDEVCGRTFYSTTAKAGTFRYSTVEADKLASRPLRQGPNKGEPTIDSPVRPPAIPAEGPAPRMTRC
jgi:hypothetical protein